MLFRSDYMVSMGFGYPLGIDLPGEKRGFIPNATNRRLAGAHAPKSAVRSGLESVRIMSKHSNAPTRRRGKALPRHGRRVKAGCVKHRKPLSIILTASWPRSMSVFCSMRSCESPSFLTIGFDLLYCKNMICLCA